MHIPLPTYDDALPLLPNKVAKEVGVKKMVIACVMSAEQADCLPLLDTIYSGVSPFLFVPATIQFQKILNFTLKFKIFKKIFYVQGKSIGFNFNTLWRDC